MSVSISTENFLQNAILNYLDSFKLACLKMESNFFMVSLHMTPKTKTAERHIIILHNIIDHYLPLTFIVTLILILTYTL